MYASRKALEDEAKRHRYSISDTAASGGYGGRDHSGGSWLFKLQVFCCLFDTYYNIYVDYWMTLGHLVMCDIYYNMWNIG
jgi:hypothetical protein